MTTSATHSSAEASTIDDPDDADEALEAEDDEAELALAPPEDADDDDVDVVTSLKDASVTLDDASDCCAGTGCHGGCANGSGSPSVGCVAAEHAATRNPPTTILLPRMHEIIQLHGFHV